MTNRELKSWRFVAETALRGDGVIHNPEVAMAMLEIIDMLLATRKEISSPSDWLL